MKGLNLRQESERSRHTSETERQRIGDPRVTPYAHFYTYPEELAYEVYCVGSSKSLLKQIKSPIRQTDSIAINAH